MKFRRRFIPSRRRVARMEREEAKRFAGRVSTVILVVGAIAALVVIANRWSKREELEGVRIIGAHVLDSAEIMQRGAVPDSIPLGRLELDAIERRILTHPFISAASVYRGEGGVLVVEVAERVPMAATLIGGDLYYIDSLGALLPYRFSTVAMDLPVISGVEMKKSASSLRLDSAQSAEVLELVARLRDFDGALYRQISEIHRRSDGEYLMTLADGGATVHFGAPEEPTSRFRKLSLFLTRVYNAGSARRASSIDLRWRGQVVVRG